VNKRKNMKISFSILVIIIMVLIFICSFVLFFEINHYRNIKSERHDFYYYFLGNRIDFEGDITLNYKDTILSLNADSIVVTSSPVYYTNYEDMMMLPSEMEIVYPYKTNPMYKVGKFAKIYYKKNHLYINSEVGVGRLYDCFFYDGQDLYVFIEPTTILVGENRYELSPMSFIEVKENYVRVYNKKQDEYIYLNNYEGKVEAYTEEYFIDLVNDTLTQDGNYYMLIKNIDGLDYVEL